MVLYEENFSLYIYTTNCFCTHIRTLLFTSHGLFTILIYIQRFLFLTTHLYTKVHSLLTRTRIPFHTSFTHRNPSVHIFLLHTGIDKNLFPFFMNMTFIHNASFSFYFWFILFFRTTFLNEKIYAIPEF